MGLDAEYRALVRRRNLRLILMHAHGTPRLASRSLIRHWFEGDDNGTRSFAVVAGCAYPDHHFVVAVLRPLSGQV
jgi:hypothetical protein